MIVTAPTKILPVSVEVTSIERLNAIPAKPPFQATDVLVFRINFKLTNPNNVLAKVDDLYFEAKAEDGTPEKTIVQAASMPSMVIPTGGEALCIWWSAGCLHYPWSWRGRWYERGTPKAGRTLDGLGG
jgi:hypothetical protein